MGTTIGVSHNRTSYIGVLKGMKLPVGAKIRIDYKRVFLIGEFLTSWIHCIVVMIMSNENEVLCNVLWQPLLAKTDSISAVIAI